MRVLPTFGPDGVSRDEMQALLAIRDAQAEALKKGNEHIWVRLAWRGPKLVDVEVNYKRLMSE